MAWPPWHAAFENCGSVRAKPVSFFLSFSMQIEIFDSPAPLICEALRMRAQLDAPKHAKQFRLDLRIRLLKQGSPRNLSRIPNGARPKTGEIANSWILQGVNVGKELF